jgi:hypothetical protein
LWPFWVAAGSTALLQIFQKQKILGNLGNLGEEKKGKMKKRTRTTRGVHIILFYFQSFNISTLAISS